MKLIYTAILMALFTIPVHAVEQDKQLHFAVAGTAQALCTATFTAITESKTWSNVGCFVAINSVGLVKELTDKQRNGTPDVNDAIANALGSGLVGLTIQIGF